MPDSQAGALNGAIRDILKVTSANGRMIHARRAEQYCRDISRRDYDLTLKQHFDRVELREIFKEIRRTLPTLNAQVFRITDFRRLAEIARKMGIVFQDHALAGSDGTGFRGFYVNEKEVLKSPIIWVNSAAPPAAAAAAFWHEVGHHLTGQIWGTSEPGTSAMNTANRDDFCDPKEIAADMVRVLAGYPKPIAERLFGGPDMEATCFDADRLVAKAIPHVRAVMGFNLRNQFSAQENVFYLGGMIHTAKLRTTLLSQYGI